MQKNWLRISLHFLCALPALWLSYQVWLWANSMPHGLSANPIEYLTDYTGGWTIRFILITLSVTPLARLFKWNIIKYRRMLGLYVFFYGLCHFLNYIVLDYFFDWQLIVEDILKRNAITFGMLAFTLLIPLAVTSNKFMIKKLSKNWQKLHMIFYGIAVLAVVHNYMMVKADVLIPSIHAIILAILLGYRLTTYIIKRRANAFKKNKVAHSI
ncbi:MAG: sulfoxide reductase heme-binding subunit YedZ [Proteobacteria bacterium]|jgi:methionine sulfoxide reductase heme-binding subunit|nr:sulfoxide reductase heme-binding subunit YedZ [Pseudomonadota bacterium]